MYRLSKPHSQQKAGFVLRTDNFLKVLALALLQGYETSMRNVYPYRYPEYSWIAFLTGDSAKR
jgi:hypothetical protein